MTRKPAASQPALRSRAEELLSKIRHDIQDMAVEDVQELISELQVQVQNEELRNTQRELETSRDKYHELYDFAPIGYLTLDDLGAIIEANQIIGAQLGVPHHDLIGKKFTQFIKPDYQDNFYLHSRKIFHTRRQQICELELIRQGDTRPFYVQLHGIATTGRNCCIAVSDITAIKNLQMELTTACVRANAANQAKNQFLTNMSHEIRTPLSAIVGLGHLLAKSSPLTSQQKDFINTLRISADSLLKLINELLDITRIETGKLTLEHIPFQLPQVLEDMAGGGLMTIKAREKGLVLTLEQEISHLYYYGDPLRLRQIVLNLVGNAIKFTQKGRITLRVETKEREDSWMDVVITVADTGIGIPQKKMGAIFDTFTQADTYNTRKYGGVGLGLTICKKLIEHMGGTIGVQSQEGKGSVFTVRLPLQMASEAPSHELSSAGQSEVIMPLAKAFVTTNATAGPCVLLVEDNPHNVLIATTLLDEFGYNYDVAYTGKEALQKMRSRDYMLILLDIHMQDMDGYELLRVIREDESKTGLPHMPVIAMTACVMRGDKEKCLKAGMDDYIPKPFLPEELRDKLACYMPALAA